MTREEAKKFIPILQAYAEGKVIECRRDPSTLNGKDYMNGWTEMKEIEYWYNAEYRVKPESKYRPFKDAEECLNEMSKHQPFGWVKDNISFGSIRKIVSLGKDFIKLGDFWYTAEIMFRKTTFLDGTPFGIKVEE